MNVCKLIILFLLLSTVSPGQQRKETLQLQVWRISEVMYHDVINPPAAARFYAYSLLAGYDIMRRLSDVDPLPLPLRTQVAVKTRKAGELYTEFAVFYGILETGKLILPSGYLLEEKQEALLTYYKDQFPPEDLQEARKIAIQVSQEIVQWSKGDGYFRLSTLKKFTPSGGDSCWRPTAPEYMQAVEPHWKTLRLFLLDSVEQFQPDRPVAFDTRPTAPFMRLVKEVYETVNNLTDEQKAIANFWDCNPFAVQFQGHMSIGLKKLSPGGHWLGITGITAEKAKLDLSSSLQLHTIVALTLHDAFTSCWDEKFRSNRLRPETAINRYIDPRWKPLLQTPPFPEYSSGHSVISSAVAEVLTSMVGDAFEFTDTIESYIGLLPRNFPSFRKAAEEACISRLYGGIHFRDAIENGARQGKVIGQFIIKKLHLKPLIRPVKALP